MEIAADIIIVGGGLEGCLTALRLASQELPPQTDEQTASETPSMRSTKRKVVLVEEDAVLGGHYTWIFRESDVGTEALTWLRPILEKSWDEAEITFPRLQQKQTGPFHGFRSESLHRCLLELLGKEQVFLRAKVTRISESHVELADGTVISARCVITALGFRESVQKLPPTSGATSGPICGFKKFLGKTFITTEPHGVSRPILIDAGVPQLDGLRYFSLIPWGEKELVVNEIYYSNSPDLNPERIGLSLISYVERKGWKVKEIVREDRGCQPIPMTSEYMSSSVGGEALPIGLRGGYLHAFTGDSLSDSVRVADFLTTIEDLSTETARNGLGRFRRPWQSRQRFYRLLSRLLFFASEPSLRYLVLQSLFMHSPDLVERLWSERTTWADRMKILRHRPEIPLDRTLRSLSETAISKWADRRTLRRPKNIPTTDHN